MYAVQLPPERLSGFDMLGPLQMRNFFHRSMGPRGDDPVSGADQSSENLQAN